MKKQSASFWPMRYMTICYIKKEGQLKLGRFNDAARTFLVLQGAAGEGMWKEESFFIMPNAF